MNPFDLAELVQSRLSSGSYGVAADYMVEIPQNDIADYTTPRVTILPGADEIENMDRAGSRDTVTIDIAIQAKLKTATPAQRIAEIKTLAGWVQALRARLERHNMTSSGTSWIQLLAQIDPIFNFTQAQQSGLFTSVMTVTYTTR